MKRLWILFKTEFNAWRYDPITVLGGFIPPGLILIAFALLFGGRLSFSIAYVNLDQGGYGQVLRQVFNEATSPLNDSPYYAVKDLDRAEAMMAYKNFQVDAVWILPPNFTESIQNGTNPSIQMLFNNYNDDRAKNHRIYSAEILWLFYKTIGQPAPPLEIAEVYPLPEMVDWLPVIAVGVVLLSMCLGAIFNIYVLTYKEQINRITLEYGLAPRSLLWVLIPKIILALIFGLASGTVFLVLIKFWLGFWPGRYLWAVWLLGGLTALFWIGIAIVVGLRSKSYMAGAIAAVLTAIVVFFIGGGLSLMRYRWDMVNWYSLLFPNTYAIDPLRDLVLFDRWPMDWQITLWRLIGFAAFSLLLGLGISIRKSRHVD